MNQDFCSAGIILTVFQINDLHFYFLRIIMVEGRNELMHDLQAFACAAAAICSSLLPADSVILNLYHNEML